MTATTLRRAGVDLKTVSARLGHSSVGITADLYTHAVAERLRQAYQEAPERDI